jgi:hypothetical protein
MPVGVGRNTGHSSHDKRRRQIHFFANIDCIGMSSEVLAKRGFGAKQSSREIAAFEVPPGEQDVLLFQIVSLTARRSW